MHLAFLIIFGYAGFGFKLDLLFVCINLKKKNQSKATPPSFKLQTHSISTMPTTHSLNLAYLLVYIISTKYIEKLPSGPVLFDGEPA